jgi:hypothetical protein
MLFLANHQVRQGSPHKNSTRRNRHHRYQLHSQRWWYQLNSCRLMVIIIFQLGEHNSQL